jgi:hypothetical protein
MIANLVLLAGLGLVQEPPLGWLVGKWCTAPVNGRTTCETWAPMGPDKAMRGVTVTRSAKGEQREPMRFGLFGEHGQAALVDLGEAAFDADRLGRGGAGLVDFEIAVADRRHQRGMPFEHAEIALGAGDDDHVHVLGADELFGRDEFEVQHFFLPYSLSLQGRGWGEGRCAGLQAPLPGPLPASGEREELLTPRRPASWPWRSRRRCRRPCRRRSPAGDHIRRSPPP